MYKDGKIKDTNDWCHFSEAVEEFNNNEKIPEST